VRWLLASLLCLAFALFARSGEAVPAESVSDTAIGSTANPPLLSAFGFFNGGADSPSPSLISYSLGTPLFSDYAEKQRFFYLPKGARLSVAANGRVSFPVGSAIIKSFGYPDASGKLKMIETRLLLHRAEGWVALPYVWRADGRDAELKLGGMRVPASFKKPNGTATQISYAVPNKNQCKQCHSTKDAIMPIGPVWQNMIFGGSASATQVKARTDFAGKPPPLEARWDDEKAGTLEKRALSYLRVNCGHCHKPGGSASNSGLFFDDYESSGAALGIGKRPVAAGRGAGNFDFVIEPGHPERSILTHRMKSTDPGVAMPELGRAMAHDEGIALLEEWIKAMKPAI
jgi:uncharacterized repeat protein (TIGR03806 family)